MQYIIFTWALCISAFLSFPAFSQDIHKFVTTGSPSSWVKEQTIPTEHFKLSDGRDDAFLLVDRQRRLTKSNTEKYSRFVQILRSSKGVEDNSTIQITFDPAYETLKIHHLTLTRDGKILDRLKLSDFDLYRLETDRNRLLYNGDLELAYVIPDVRIGDTLDYAYTVSGKNPAIGPHISASLDQQYSVAIQHLHRRILVADDIDVFWKSHQAAIEPTLTKVDGYTVYTWEYKNREGIIVDGKRPYWYFAYPETQLSSFQSWAEVGQYFAPFYAVSDDNLSVIKPIAEKIKLKANTKKEQLRLALDFVQREIRYMGIEIGAGGYIPRTPTTVLTNRYGDCKDMVLLLIHILEALDIEATPLLVNSYKRDKIEISIPRYNEFDHVIVYAKVDGKDYYVDPTRGQQLGNIDTFHQGSFGKGLIVSSDSVGIVTANPSKPDYFQDFEDTYDLISDPDTATLKSVTTYYMTEADSLNNWYKTDGLDAIEKEYLEYYQDIFPTIKQAKPMEIEIFEKEGKAIVTSYYSIPNVWELSDDQKVKTFSAYAEDLYSSIPKFVGAKRTAPYRISHPARVRYTLNMILDDSWNIKNKEKSFSVSAFDFKKSSIFSDNIYKQVYTYRTKTDHITPKEFSHTMSIIKDIRDILGVELTEDIEDKNTKNAANTESKNVFLENIEAIVLSWFLLTLIVSLIGAIKQMDKDIEWRSKQILYPVAMKKFIPLSIITLGMYQLYWIFKNWLWLKQVDKQNISPGWRTFFAVIMNLSLFIKIAHTKPQGFKWYKKAVIPLAALYFIGQLSDPFSNSEEKGLDLLSLITYVGSILALTLVAMQVNKMNEDRKEYIIKNSQYSWSAISMMAMFFPILCLVLYGLFLA